MRRVVFATSGLTQPYPHGCIVYTSPPLPPLPCQRTLYLCTYFVSELLWTTSCSRHQLPERECAHHSPGDRYSETCTSLKEQHVYIVNLLTTYVLSVSFSISPTPQLHTTGILHLQPSPLLLYLHHHLVQLNRTTPSATTKCQNQ